MIENTQFPNSVREHRWKRLGWPEQWKIFFRQILVNEGRSDQTYSYKFRRLDLLELFVERYYTYYAELIDPAQKAREAEIETFLVHRGGDHRLTTLLDKGWRSGPDPRQKILARLANRRIRKALEGDWEAEVRRKASSSHLGSSFDQTTFSGSCSPTAETRRRERRERRCKSCHEHQLQRSKA